MSNLNYKNSGVDTEFGNYASKIFYEAAKLTWENKKGKLGEVVELFDDFSGLRAIHVGGLPEGTYMNLGFDSIGTKAEIYERTVKHDTAAYDLFAMVCDDAVVRGAEPVIVGSILDVRSLEEDGQSYLDFIKQLAKGYVSAAKDANVAVVNGEVAELGARINGFGHFNYNWGAAVVWFAKKSRMLTGYEIKVGDKIIGLREAGFRSNGLSLVRKIMQETHGENWHEEIHDGKNLAELILEPSRIYTPAVVDMFGGFDKKSNADIHGVVHITGGGIPEKLGRVLKPSGFGAYLENLFEPPDLMLYCQEKGGVIDEDAYKTWNMGQGMIIVSPDAHNVMKIAFEHGIESKIIGEIYPKPNIVIKSRGLNSEKNKELVF